MAIKTFRKTRKIHNFSMTFSSNASLCLEGYFHKRWIPAPEGISSYRKHALDLCFVTSYSMIRNESGEHISDCGLLSMSCPKPKGPLYGIYQYSPTLHTQRCNPSWSENLCVQVPIAYIQPGSTISWLHPCTQLASSYSDPEAQLASSPAIFTP